MKTKKLPDEIKSFYRPCLPATAFAVVTFFVLILLVCWYFTGGVPRSELFALIPRQWLSLPAIVLSNFFHINFLHLLNNLIYFVPLGFFVFKQEGLFRGVEGIFTGMIVAGTAVWLFGGENTVHVGFSGAVLACVGILLVRSIRESVIQTVVLLALLYIFLENVLFETIRPTAHTEKHHISWLGHLGGLIGGMMAQIRSLPIALEMLYKQGYFTEKEFVTFATRIRQKDKPQDCATDGNGGIKNTKIQKVEPSLGKVEDDETSI